MADAVRLLEANLALYFSSEPHGFVCPSCLRFFSASELAMNPDLVNEGHIHPNAVGGSDAVPECERCNSALGSEADSHLVNEYRWYAWQRGDPDIHPLRAVARVGTDQVNVRIGRSNDRWAIDVSDKNNRPIAPAAFRANFGGTGPDQLQLAIQAGFAIGPARLGSVHTAHLLLFKAFGYEYALSPGGMATARALKGRDAQFAMKAVRDIPQPNSPELQAMGIGAARFSDDTRCWAVRVPSPDESRGRRLVFLPGFETPDVEAYSRLGTGEGGPGLQVTVTHRHLRATLARLADANWMWQGHAILDDLSSPEPDRFTSAIPPS